MLMYISLIGWSFIFVFILKYLVARFVFKMSHLDLQHAIEKDNIFFVIKSSLDK